jgi:hypothetical protein
MTELLDRLTHTGGPVKHRDALARKIKNLNRYELQPGDVIGPNLSNAEYARVLRGYSALWQLPDDVKSHPQAAQRAYLMTFNNWLAKCGDHAKSTRAAYKALRNKLSQLQDMKRRSFNRGGFDEGLVTWGVKRLAQGPKVQIVVP